MSYPILLNLRGRHVVVVGGGTVAARKVADLLAAGALVTIISPTLHDDLAAQGEQITARLTAYESGMLNEIDPLLVFAATNSEVVNQQVAQDARALGMLVNTTSDGKAGDFTNMATIQRGEITIGLATGGASPALAAHLREQIENTVNKEYDTLVRWMGELRPVVKAKVPMEKRAALWQAILESSVLAHLRDGDEAGARAIIDTLIRNAANESD